MLIQASKIARIKKNEESIGFLFSCIFHLSLLASDGHENNDEISERLDPPRSTRPKKHSLASADVYTAFGLIWGILVGTQNPFGIPLPVCTYVYGINGKSRNLL